MRNPSILVSGASIAGPTVASWLGAAGWDVTVVERFDHLRDEGQNVDVRGLGREIMRRMGLEDAVRAHHTRETGMSLVDADGRAYATFPAGADEGDTRPTAELEILRGQLARLLHEHSSTRAEYVFGDQITALHDDGHGVDVDFIHGASRRFDAVVIAEGSRSRSRQLLFPDARPTELGLFAAFATIPRTAEDDRQWRIHFGGRGRLVHLRPDNVGTTRAMFSLRADVRGLHHLDRAATIAVLRETFGDVGWETPRILDALDDAPLYTDQIAQIRLPRWSRGRIGLLGDAAWCPGPFGTGTSTALSGAYVLAGELAATPDGIPAAFARYERLLRPQADRAQTFVPRPGSHPNTPGSRARLEFAMRLAGGPLGRAVRFVDRIPAPPVDSIELPDYPLRELAGV